MLYKQYDGDGARRLGGDGAAVLHGNASVARRHLLDAGGFDEAFRRAEDVELAYRLADRGLRFTFAQTPSSIHHAERSFDSWLDIARAVRPQRRHLRPRPRPALAARRRSATSSTAATASCGRSTRTCAAAPAAAPRRRSACCTGVARGAERAAPRGRSPSRRSARSTTSPTTAAWPTSSAIRPPHAARCSTTSTPGEAPARRASASCSSRRSATSPTPTTCSTSSAPTSRSTPCSQPIDFDVDGLARPTCPGFGNWTVRAGHPGPAGDPPAAHAAGRSTRCSSTPRCRRSCRPTTSRRIPTVVSLDATPIQYDELGAHYGHDTGSRARRAAEVAGQPGVLRPRRGGRRVGRVDEAGPRRPLRRAGRQDRRDPARRRLRPLGRRTGATATPSRRRRPAARAVRRRRPRAQGRARAPRGRPPAARRRRRRSSSTSSRATSVPEPGRRARPPRARRRTARR